MRREVPDAAGPAKGAEWSEFQGTRGIQCMWKRGGARRRETRRTIIEDNSVAPSRASAPGMPLLASPLSCRAPAQGDAVVRLLLPGL